jgi:hypothetical protein
MGSDSHIGDTWKLVEHGELDEIIQFLDDLEVRYGQPPKPPDEKHEPETKPVLSNGLWVRDRRFCANLRGGAIHPTLEKP